ncbi:uncharacterized protein C8Q71DRAFT_761490 [Rhodofomes roseus]|uniref:Uncharacterized protein n=1 Tax=Rhodofomes roseus TaxID=34475 RepID=A0ABQ8KEV8_9APHY|nr:uncharacterized protein C8Q71DRAFT_761490 [Rhodofomes roseus]KAH9836256.1 hypothetical protein C8Q71DRAFT_761490 [Rhodofomes roseus]
MHSGTGWRAVSVRSAFRFRKSGAGRKGSQTCKLVIVGMILAYYTGIAIPKPIHKHSYIPLLPERRPRQGTLPAHPTPVHDEQLAAHVLARPAREEDDGPRKVPRFAPPPSGDALRDLAEARGVLEELLVHVGRDVSRADPVHLHVVLAPLIAERLRELAERALRRRIRGHGEPALRPSKPPSATTSQPPHTQKAQSIDPEKGEKQPGERRRGRAHQGPYGRAFVGPAAECGRRTRRHTRTWNVSSEQKLMILPRRRATMCCPAACASSQTDLRLTFSTYVNSKGQRISTLSLICGRRIAKGLRVKVKRG